MESRKEEVLVRGDLVSGYYYGGRGDRIRIYIEGQMRPLINTDVNWNVNWVEIGFLPWGSADGGHVTDLTWQSRVFSEEPLKAENPEVQEILDIYRKEKLQGVRGKDLTYRLIHHSSIDRAKEVFPWSRKWGVSSSYFRLTSDKSDLTT